MKILQVCNKPPYPPRDGGSLAMFSLARALHTLGHQVTVLTMFTRKHKLTVEHHQAYTRFMDVHSVYVDAGVRLGSLVYNILFSVKPYTASRFRSSFFEDELVRILSNSEFDIVQLEGLYLTQYIPAIKKCSSAKIALRAHNVEHEIWTRIADAETNYLKKKYFRLLAQRLKRFEEMAMNTYDLLVPITERDNVKFRQMGNTKPSHVCTAGVDIIQYPDDTVSTQLPTRAFTLYYLGSLDWIPNQEGLLWFINKVFRGLHQKYHDLKLHVAGRNATRSLIHRLEVHGVVFHGEIEDPVSYSQNYSAMIAPCFSGSGMRMKVIEAMALCKPVITTTIGAEGLMAVNGEHLMIADEPESFANSIESLMKYPDLCRKLGQNGYNLVNEKYNNSYLAGKLAEFYKQNLK